MKHLAKIMMDKDISILISIAPLPHLPLIGIKCYDEDYIHKNHRDEVSMSGKNVGLIVGSLRKEAWSRKVADKLIKFSPPELSLKLVNINNLPIYNEDDETTN